MGNDDASPRTTRSKAEPAFLHPFQIRVATTREDEVGAQRFIRLLVNHGVPAIGRYSHDKGWGVFVTANDAPVAESVLNTLAAGPRCTT